MCNNTEKIRKKEAELHLKTNEAMNIGCEKRVVKLSSEQQFGGQKRKLPHTFCPGPMDVICARGSAVYNHPGNKRFRDIIQMNLKRYSEARNKMEKSQIVSVIVASIRTASPEGGFIKLESGWWYEVGDHIAREKVGQSFRDSLHTMYRSSSKAKNHRSKAKKTLLRKVQKKNEVKKSSTIPKQATVVVKQEETPHEPISMDVATVTSNQVETYDDVDDNLDSFDYVGELFRAFLCEDTSTAMNSLNYQGNDDTKKAQPIAVEERSACWRRDLNDYNSCSTDKSTMSPALEQLPDFGHLLSMKTLVGGSGEREREK